MASDVMRDDVGCCQGVAREPLREAPRRPAVSLRWSVMTAVALLAGSVGTATWAQSPQRIMDAIDVLPTASRIDIAVQFTCQVRYVNHSPASEGRSLRIHLALGRDCSIAGAGARAESLPVPADMSVLRSITLSPLVANDVEVELQFVQDERFVLAPTGDLQGLRIRLLRPGIEAPRTRVLVNELPEDAVTGYAVNLDSGRQPFPLDDVEEAARLLGTRAFVSETTISGTRWYRLRIGPFAKRADADRALLAAKRQYPRAWLAIADDESAPEPAAAMAPPRLPARNGDVVLDDEEAERLYRLARREVRQRHYAAAIELLTRLLNSQNTSQRADAQELIGLARERNGQLAHAKAEYEAYLREFPDGPGVDRVAQRLSALRSAGKSAGGGGLFGGDGDPEHAWRVYGGASQLYRWDTNEITTDTSTTDFNSQNALLSDFDVVARRRGTRFETVARASTGYIMDLLPEGPGDQVRLSSAFFEVSDRIAGWTARTGRQSRNSGGLLGTFDGLFGSYRLLRQLTINAAFGYPVESSTEGLDSDRQLGGVSVDFGSFGAGWEPSLYVVQQTYDGELDRQAVGAEIRYFVPGRTLLGYLDYDTHYQELGSAVLIGTLALPWRWTMNVNLERRKSPVLTTRNALIGQPVLSLDELLATYTLEEVEQLALDRTADSEIYGITFSRPFGERLQLMLNASSYGTSATLPSGGVEGIPESGPDLAFYGQLLAMSLWRAGDVNAVTARYQTSDSTRAMSLGLSSRLPVWGAWRLGPQLRVDRSDVSSLDSSQWLYAPSLRLDLQLSKLLLELELGAEFRTREAPALKEETLRYYFSLGYRMNF